MSLHTAARIILLAALMWITSKEAHAQDSTSYSRDSSLYEIRLKSGSILIAKILEQKRDYIRVESESGISRIERADIEKIEVFKRENTSSEKMQNRADAVRYALNSTAHTLDKGRFLYRSTAWIAYQSLHYGVTDKFMVGIGTLPFSLADFPVIGLSSKLNFLDHSNLNLSLSYEGFFFPSADNDGFIFDEPNYFGFYSIVSTYGNYKDNFSFGVALAQADNIIADIPYFQLGGKKHIGGKWSFLADGFFVSVDDEFLYTANIGVRIASKNHFFDIFFALAGAESEFDFLAVPVGNYGLGF